jgi:ribosomal-protein-alanine N-acetyltransferase
MRTRPNLDTAHGQLRLAEASDVLAIIRYYAKNEAHLKPFEPARPADFDWRARVLQAQAEFQEDRSLRLFLFANDAATVIGSVNFSNFVRGAFQACHLGFSLDIEREGQGVMSSALRVALRYVFDELRLHRVMANHLRRNHRSAALLKKLGFVVEGIAHDYLLIDGRWRDHVLTSLTKPDWKP